MTTQSLAIATQSGDIFDAYLAIPTSGHGPGLIVIQEIFGVNDVMRQIADAYAQLGYVALVPDLFWRQEPSVQLSDRTDEDWQKAFQLYQGFDEDMGTQDLMVALAALRRHSACIGKVGSVGYCLGGKLAYLMATRSDADCNVAYYGVGIENNLHEAKAIQHPLMLHMAEQDQFVPADAQQNIMAHLQTNSLIAIHSYANVSHGFA